VFFISLRPSKLVQGQNFSRVRSRFFSGHFIIFILSPILFDANNSTVDRVTLNAICTTGKMRTSFLKNVRKQCRVEQL
jgi:hypothetical protein